jgi:tetratricopeptide (TPR) repeat protein
MGRFRGIRLIAAVAVSTAAIVACGSGSGGQVPKADVGSVLADGLKALDQGDTKLAKQLYQAVLRQDPTNKYALYNLGYIAQVAKDPASAIEWYTKALASDSTFASARFNRAVAYTDSNDAANAIADYRILLAIDPKNARVMYNLGNVLIASKNPTEGIPLVQQALVLDPSLAPAGASH